MSCKDCFHNDVCEKKHYHYTTNKYREDIDFIEQVCKFFKDKSKVIELPCKVGDTIYFVLENIHQIEEGKIKEIVINKYNTKIINIDFGYMCKQFDIEYVGKTVFLTKEEAEARLKELQNGTT